MPIKDPSSSSPLQHSVARKLKNGIRLRLKRMPHLKKTALIVAGALTGFVILVIVFISPIAKFLIEKYDTRFTGRQIEMDWAYVNPFSGYVHLGNVKIYEYQSDSIFLSARGITANIEIFKLFSKTYTISELTLNQPRGIIIQIDKDLNFDDLIRKFSPKNDAVKTGKAVHFSILSIKITNGEFLYRERVTPINYFIKNVNIESTGIRWDSDTIAATYAFTSGIGGGSMKGDFAINIKNLGFLLAVAAQEFDLNILEQYLIELTNFGYFKGNIDADLKVKGSFKTAENVTFAGQLAINDFMTGERPGEKYASFQKLTLAIIELSPKKHKYLFDSVSLNKPYFKYERYDYLDNLTRMFAAQQSGASGETESSKFNLILEIGNYIKRLSQNFFKSNYKLNRLAIYDGDLEYNDYSIREKFAIHLNPLFVVADSIAKSEKMVNVSVTSGIMPYGNVSVNLSINPADSSDFDLGYRLQKIPLAMFNPYLIQYTSFPFDRGTLSLTGTWHVRNGIISSDNHLLVIDPRITKRLKNKDTRWLPMRFILAFIRERGNVIDYEVPISGDLKDPKFHLKDVIVDVLGNIFVKPATTPYRMQVKSIETEIEKSLSLKWGMRHSSLTRLQEKFIDKMVGFLAKNPGAILRISPQQFTTKEKEYILLFEAKKKYFLATRHQNSNSLSEDDSLKIESMSVKDALFVRYLNNHTADSMLFTIQDKCSRLIDSSLVDAKYIQLNRARERAFMRIFKESNVEKQVRFSAGTRVIPYNGFSFYKLDYKGEYPETLLLAYRRMNELNNEAPRNLFKKERKRNKNVL